MHIYVGNFPETTTEQDLRNAFEPFGDVRTITLITDPINEHVLGFAFVEMPDSEEGTRAIEALNHSKIHGRTIMVTRTNDRVDRRRRAPRAIAQSQEIESRH